MTDREIPLESDDAPLPSDLAQLTLGYCPVYVVLSETHLPYRQDDLSCLGVFRLESQAFRTVLKQGLRYALTCGQYSPKFPPEIASRIEDYRKANPFYWHHVYGEKPSNELIEELAALVSPLDLRFVVSQLCRSERHRWRVSIEERTLD